MTYRDTARRRQDVKDAVSGVAMTERDERLLDWLAATWDQDTTTALADLIARSRPPRLRQAPSARTALSVVGT